VISTAIKKGVAEPGWIEAAIESMTTLNKTAAEVIGEFRAENGLRPSPSGEVGDFDFPIHALTDITGFGLIGHLREMLVASERVSAKLFASRVPLLRGSLECVHSGHIPGGLKANREFAECLVTYSDSVADDLRTILFDPQTAGGLLVSVSAEAAPELTNSLLRAGVSAVEIGLVSSSTKPEIEVVR
jgi:selenide,water dikinase